MKFVAVVPVKENSTRVPGKNFKPFSENLSLFEFKVHQLIQAECFDEIYVSSDSNFAKEVCSNLNINFIRRESKYCDEKQTTWSDLIFNVVHSIPVQDDTYICWTHVTTPLFSRYKEAIEVFKSLNKEDYDGLISVLEVKEFFMKGNGRPYNYSWGVWHEYSQQLESLFRVTYALFIAKKEEMIKNRYVTSRKPYLFKCTPYESVDIDNLYDFKLAQLLYSNKSVFQNL